MSEKDIFPSLDLIFELMKEAIAGQREQVNSLDSKANFILGSATAFVSAALVLQAVLLTPSTVRTSSAISCPILANKFLHTLPLLGVLLMYLCVLFAAYLAYKVRTYKQAPNPDELYNTYLVQEESKTKAEIFEAMRHAYKLNTHTIEKKTLLLKVSFILLGGEALALIVYVVFQSLC